jgi:hypothetical protein
MNANALVRQNEPRNRVHSALQHFPDSLDLVEGPQLIAFAAFPHPSKVKVARDPRPSICCSRGGYGGDLAVTALVNRPLASWDRR